METLESIRISLFLLTVVGLLWFATTDTFLGIWEKNVFNLSLILFWICLGAGVGWLIIALVKPDMHHEAVYSMQTILQDIALLIVLIAVLSPFGLIYQEYAGYYAKNICFPVNSSFDIYPFGRNGQVAMYEKGSLFNPGATNSSWISAIPRANCAFKNNTDCLNLTQNMSKRLLQYQN
jgi:hypothetical protein